MLKKLKKKRRLLELGFALGFALTVLLTAFAAHRRQVADRVCARHGAAAHFGQQRHAGGSAGQAAGAGCHFGRPARQRFAGRHHHRGRSRPAAGAAVLHQAAQQALYKAHSPQTARLKLERLDFAPRDYGSFALPGGRYTALRVELGEGKGHNWFCVLYPALCVSGAQAKYPSQAENALVFGRYEVRFAVVDAVKNWIQQ